MDNFLEKNKELQKDLNKEQEINQEKKEVNVDQLQNGDVHKTEQIQDVLLKHQEVPADGLQIPELSKEENDYIMGKGKLDLPQLGMGMNLSALNVDHSESAMRGNVKKALHNYIEIRKSVLAGKNDDSLSAEEREVLGGAYEQLERLVDAYVAAHSDQEKYGKGKSRLKKMARIKELIHMDNRFFMLSDRRRGMMESFDGKYEGSMGFPTLLKAVHAADSISNRNQIYNDTRKKQAKNDELPSLSQRHGEWWKTAMKNNWDRAKVVYNVAGGLVDHTIGVGTMIASNALIFAGKLAKMPLKLLSMAFNTVSRKYKLKKSWTVDYSFTKGWAGLTESRQIFRDCSKGLVALPVGMYESLTHGFPYIFRKVSGKSKKTDKVYKASGKLFQGIGARVKNIMRGLGFYKNYIDLKEIEKAGTIEKTDNEEKLLKNFQSAQDELEGILGDFNAEADEELKEGEKDKEKKAKEDD